MTKFKQKSSKVITGLLLASFLFFPSYKSAQAATTEYKPQTQQEMIAYLLGVLSQLQIQLEQQKGEGGSTNAPSRENVTSRPNPYFVNLLVQSPESISRDQATLRGLIYPGSSKTIEAWFEYGIGTNLKYRSKVYSSLETTSTRSTSRSSRTGVTTRASSGSVTSPTSTTTSVSRASSNNTTTTRTSTATRTSAATDRSSSSGSTRSSGTAGGEKIFLALVEDLKPNTKYTYRLVAEDEKGYRHYSPTRTFTTVAAAQKESFAGAPGVDTEGVKVVKSSSATISGFVTLNDYDQGIVFFMYGTDQKLVDDIEDYDTYNEVPVLSNSLKKVLVEDEFTGRDTVTYNLQGLKAATPYYYRTCLEYDDNKKGDSLLCGDVESFVTQN